MGGVEEEKQRFFLRSHSERILFSIQSLGRPGTFVHLLFANIKHLEARKLNCFILSIHYGQHAISYVGCSWCELKIFHDKFFDGMNPLLI